MARLTYIGGRSGTGKSTSFRTLNPSTTFILNADSHELPFAYQKDYNDKAGNYAEGSSLAKIGEVFTLINNDTRFKVAIIDTWSRVMTDYIMSRKFRTAVDGRKAWGKFAQDMYDLLDTINNGLRKDLNVYLISHIDSVESEHGLRYESINVPGQQLAKMVPESFATVVLYTHVETLPGQRPTYHFRTNTEGLDTCKSPIGMFEEMLIPNDLNLVNDTINNFYN